MRLIDADAIHIPKMETGLDDTKMRIAIANTPTVETVPEVHGKWEERQTVDDSTIIEIWQSARCSKCGRYHTTPYAYYFDEFNYCPQCGAKMDEVTE